MLVSVNLFTRRFQSFVAKSPNRRNLLLIVMPVIPLNGGRFHFKNFLSQISSFIDFRA